MTLRTRLDYIADKGAFVLCLAAGIALVAAGEVAAWWRR